MASAYIPPHLRNKKGPSSDGGGGGGGGGSSRGGGGGGKRWGSYAKKSRVGAVAAMPTTLAEEIVAAGRAPVFDKEALRVVEVKARGLANIAAFMAATAGKVTMEDLELCVKEQAALIEKSGEPPRVMFGVSINPDTAFHYIPNVGAHWAGAAPDDYSVLSIVEKPSTHPCHKCGVRGYPNLDVEGVVCYGHVEKFDKDAIDAARREAFEESGVLLPRELFPGGGGGAGGAGGGDEFVLPAGVKTEFDCEDRKGRPLKLFTLVVPRGATVSKATVEAGASGRGSVGGFEVGPDFVGAPYLVLNLPSS